MRTLFYALIAMMVNIGTLQAETRLGISTGSATVNEGPFRDCLASLFMSGSCAPIECEAPHPFMSGFTVRHRVFGMREGKCLYVQTMPCDPGKQCYLECRYPPDSLADKKKASERLKATGEMDMDDASSKLESDSCTIHGYD